MISAIGMVREDSMQADVCNSPYYGTGISVITDVQTPGAKYLIKNFGIRTTCRTCDFTLKSITQYLK